MTEETALLLLEELQLVNENMGIVLDNCNVFVFALLSLVFLVSLFFGFIFISTLCRYFHSR